MLLSISKHLAYGYKPYNIDFEKLKSAILTEHSMAPCFFKDFHKCGEKWLEAGDVLIFDFDLGVTREAIKKILNQKISYLIHTTKSHNKLKNGILSERFRLYIQTKKITLNKIEYEFLMRHICTLLGADIQCTHGSAAFKGYRNAEIEVFESDFFNWEPLWNKIKNEIPQPKEYILKTDKREGFMNKDNWEKMFKPENILDGSRNYHFARICYWCKDSGCNFEDALDVMNWINSKISSPVKQKEIDSIVKCVFRNKI